MLNRNGSRQCRRIVVQSKETLTATWSAAWPSGLVAAETRGSTAARQAAGTLPWNGVNDPAEEAARESVNVQLRGPEKLTGAHDPQHALQKSGGLTDQWYMDDGAAFSAGLRRRQRHSRNRAEPTENRSYLRRERSGCSAT